MKKLTFKKITSRWLKLWPLNLFLIMVGVVTGLSSFLSIVQTYDSTAEILILNNSKNIISATDYAYIFNSGMVAGKINNEDCTVSSTQAGSVMTVSSVCESSGEAAIASAKSSIEVFKTVMAETYGEDMVSVSVITEPYGGMAVISGARKLVILLAPIMAVLVLSAIIAFILV